MDFAGLVLAVFAPVPDFAAAGFLAVIAAAVLAETLGGIFLLVVVDADRLAIADFSDK
jgi:hypothetical protein